MFNPGKAKHPWKDLRSICLTIDSFIYFILSLVFKMFFNIVNSNFIDNDIINQFYSNIQLLLGVFITFKLCFSLINYIINPDRVSDNKVGAGKLIMRVVVALCMLTLLVPLSNIPDYDAPSGSYNEAIKSKGILFGTLQIVQEKILSQNVIGALILGVRNQNNVNSNYEVQADSIVAGILKGFIQIAKDDNGQQYCNIKEYDNYNKTSYYGTVLLYAEEKTCEYNNDDYYAFSYIFLGSWICGALFIIVVAGFCVDVAIRMIKLTVLRLIAPIPIISYISPESGKNGAFNSWVKMLTKTYLDLFLRIAIIYFVVYISSTLLAEDTIIFSSDNGTLNTFSRIFIWLGLFMFAKQAPKFFMDMLGMKGDGKGFFSGLKSVAGLGALAVGTVATGVSYGRTSYDEGLEKDRKFNRLKSFGAGLVGATSGFVGGAWAGLRANDNNNMASEIRRNQQQRMALRAAGVTFLGRVSDTISLITTGQTSHQRDEALIGAYQQFYDLYDNIANKADVDDTKFSFSYVDDNGITHSLNNTSVKQLKDEYERLKLSNADASTLQAAEERYKKAQASRIEQRIAAKDNTDLIYQYYTQASQIAKSHGEILRYVDANGKEQVYDLSKAGDFKIAHFNAQDRINEMKFGRGRNRYNARRAVSEANNNRR